MRCTLGKKRDPYNKQKKENEMRKFCISIGALFLVTMSFGIGMVQAAEFIAFAGGPASGSYGKAGAAMAVVVNNLSDGKINMTSQSSAGGQENILTVNNGLTQLGAAAQADIHEAYHGKGFFKKQKMTNIRLMGLMMESASNFVVLDDSPIRSLEDIEGMTVSLGSPTSATRGLSERLLDHIGIKVKKRFLPGGPAAKALKDGHIDAYVWAPSVPDASLIDLASTKKIRLIDLGTPAEESGFFKKYSFYYMYTIPASTYRGVDYDVKTIGTGVYCIVNKDFDENTAYEITKLTYENPSATKKAFGPLKSMRGEASSIRRMDIPLHLGAHKYWAEKGVSIPAALQPK
jgi:uncharacterized protein